MEVAKLAPWSRFDCLGGCCTFISWTSVHQRHLCAHRTNLEVATLRGMPSRLEPRELCSGGVGDSRGTAMARRPIVYSSPASEKSSLRYRIEAARVTRAAGQRLRIRAAQHQHQRQRVSSDQSRTAGP